jgi:hypothetical protein
MCCVPALNKLRLAMMAMITMTMKMITNTAIEDNSAQRRQPCCGGGGGENELQQFHFAQARVIYGLPPNPDWR